MRFVMFLLVMWTVPAFCQLAEGISVDENRVFVIDKCGESGFYSNTTFTISSYGEQIELSFSNLENCTAGLDVIKVRKFPNKICGCKTKSARLLGKKSVLQCTILDEAGRVISEEVLEEFSNYVSSSHHKNVEQCLDRRNEVLGIVETVEEI